jgi:uncharacterized protein DUF4145
MERNARDVAGMLLGMSARPCPFCHALVNFERVWSQNSPPPGSGFTGSVDLAAMRCSNKLCGMFIIAILDNERIVQHWPQQVMSKTFPDVPDHIAAAASEAYRCYSIQAYRAAVLLARSVIEATAKEKGIDKGALAVKIDLMQQQNLIREYVKDAAHEVRFLGNEMAHGDFVTPVDEAEAELTLTLMDEVLNEVFQAPERVAAARAARQARAAQAPTP